MRKRYLILQPPDAPYFTLLVDEISSDSNWGRTTDMEKFEYNLDVLDGEFKIMIEIHTALSMGGMTRVEHIGRFITIIEISKDETIGTMTFYDFTIPLDKKILQQEYSDVIVNEVIIAQKFMNEHFDSKDDNVILLREPLIVR